MLSLNSFEKEVETGKRYSSQLFVIVSPIVLQISTPVKGTLLIDIADKRSDLTWHAEEVRPESTADKMMQVREKYHQLHCQSMVSLEPVATKRIAAEGDEDLEVTYLREQLQGCFRLITELENEKRDMQQQMQNLKTELENFKNESDKDRIGRQTVKMAAPVDEERKPKLLEPKVLEPANGMKVMMPLKLPPPPPPLSKMAAVKSKAVRRMPEVIEFYRSLTRKDSRVESRTNGSSISEIGFSKNMIGEIENRSSYLMAIKTDVETQGEFIDFLTKEVTAAEYTKISDVEAFVKWLDGELSSLVDERAVLRHFRMWPERKADALREAACSFRDLKNLECEILSYKDDHRQTSSQAFSKMQALQHRLELRVGDIERTKESSIKKYKEMHIPWEWMQEIMIQLKLSSMKLAKQYMARTVKELKSTQGQKQKEMLLQGVRFAYRVHQFAGGFDADTTKAFEELRQFQTQQTRKW